jgi:hypothetical protein
MSRYHKMALKIGVPGREPDSTGSGQGPLSAFCEDSNQRMGCIQDGECADLHHRVACGFYAFQSETQF